MIKDSEFRRIHIQNYMKNDKIYDYIFIRKKPQNRFEAKVI